MRFICVANIKKAYITYYLIIVRLIGPKPFLFLGISHSLQTSCASNCRNGHSTSFQCSYTIIEASLQAAHAIMITFFTSCMAASCMFMFVLLHKLRGCTCPFFTRCVALLVLFFFYPLRSCACPFLPVAWLCSYLNYHLLRGCARTLSPAYVTWLYLSFFYPLRSFLVLFSPVFLPVA